MTRAKDDFDAMCVASFSWAFATLGAGSYSEFLDVGELLNPVHNRNIGSTIKPMVMFSVHHDMTSCSIIICDPHCLSEIAGHLDEPLLEVVALAVEKRVSSCKTQDNSAGRCLRPYNASEITLGVRNKNFTATVAHFPSNLAGMSSDMIICGEAN